MIPHSISSRGSLFLLYFLGLQNHCRWRLQPWNYKRHLLLRRKAMTNLESLLKSRDTTLPTKVHLVKTMVFPVVMYGCDNWTIKKAECQRIDDFELWCWRRLLRVPWTTRKSNQSILKEISPEYSLEIWCKELTHWKEPDSGKDWSQEEKGITEGEMVRWHHWLNEHEFEEAPGVGDEQGNLACCSPWGSQRVGHDWATELNWKENNWLYFTSTLH